MSIALLASPVAPPLNPHPAAPAMGPSLVQAVEAFLAWRAPGVATRKTYASVFRLFEGWALEHPAPFGEQVRLWVQHLVQANKRAATVEVHASALRQLGHYLVTTGQLPAQLLVDLACLVVPQAEGQVYQRASLSKRQARRLVERAGNGSVAEKRTQAIVALMLRAGLRSCEVVRARMRHLQTVNDTPVLWVHGKGRLSADNYVVLNPKAQEAVAAYLATRGQVGPEEPLFTSLDGRGQGPITERQVQRVVTQALEAAELKTARTSTHSLRHTAATLAIGAGAPLVAAQRMLRHADSRTTSRYIIQHRRLKRSAESALDF